MPVLFCINYGKQREFPFPSWLWNMWKWSSGTRKVEELECKTSNDQNRDFANIATDAAEQMEENSIIIWPRLCYSNTILNGMPLLPFEFSFLLSYCWCFFRYIFVKVFHYISLLFDSVYHLFIKIFHLMCTYTMVTLWYGS